MVRDTKTIMYHSRNNQKAPKPSSIFQWLPCGTTDSVCSSSNPYNATGSKTGCAVWVGGMQCLFSPVNHSNISQSRASVNSVKNKEKKEKVKVLNTFLPWRSTDMYIQYKYIYSTWHFPVPCVCLCAWVCMQVTSSGLVNTSASAYLQTREGVVYGRSHRCLPSNFWII